MSDIAAVLLALSPLLRRGVKSAIIQPCYNGLESETFRGSGSIMAEQENGWRIGLDRLTESEHAELQDIMTELGPVQIVEFAAQVREQLEGEQRADFDALNDDEKAQVVASILQQQGQQVQMLDPMQLFEMVQSLSPEQQDGLRQVITQLPDEERSRLTDDFQQLVVAAGQEAEFNALSQDEKDMVAGFLVVQQVQQMQAAMDGDGQDEEEDAPPVDPGLRGLLTVLTEEQKTSLRQMVTAIDPIQKITLRQQIRAILPDEQKAEFDSFTDVEKDVVLAFIMVQQQAQAEAAQNLQSSPRRSPLL